LKLIIVIKIIAALRRSINMKMIIKLLIIFKLQLLQIFVRGVIKSAFFQSCGKLIEHGSARINEQRTIAETAHEDGTQSIVEPNESSSGQAP